METSKKIIVSELARMHSFSEGMLPYSFEYKTHACISRTPIFDMKNRAKFFYRYSFIAIS